MNWLELWAKIEVILEFVGLGILALCILAFIINALVVFIRYEYRKHSKKYEYDPFKNDYVRKKTNK